MTSTTYQALTIARLEEQRLRTRADRTRQTHEATVEARAASRCRRALRTLAALRPLHLLRGSTAHRLQAPACGC